MELPALTTAAVVCLWCATGSTGLAADTEYFIRLKGVGGSDTDVVKATGAALESGRTQLRIPAPSNRVGAQGG